MRWEPPLLFSETRPLRSKYLNQRGREADANWRPALRAARARAAEVLQPSPICSLFSRITKGEGNPTLLRGRTRTRALRAKLGEDYTELELLRRRAPNCSGKRLLAPTAELQCCPSCQQKTCELAAAARRGAGRSGGAASIVTFLPLILGPKVFCFASPGAWGFSPGRERVGVRTLLHPWGRTGPEMR